MIPPGLLKIRPLVAAIVALLLVEGVDAKAPEPPADFVWPEAIAYLDDDCSLYRGGHSSLRVTVFTSRNSKAFPEFDLPSPVKVGRKLMLLKPARPGVEPKLLLDAGMGAIGSPSASYDGKWIYVSMALEDEAFYHIYRVPAGGGEPQRLTDGPFHDIDPAELPDGRIIFCSTRTGRFEEYHSSPSRAVFTMDQSGKNILPLTHTIIFEHRLIKQLYDDPNWKLSYLDHVSVIFVRRDMNPSIPELDLLAGA